MKKHILLTSIILATLLITSCFRKGEDDPLISFQSRKARVAGKWEVSSIVANYNYINLEDASKNKSSNYMFDGTKYTITENLSSYTKNSGTEKWTWDFDKKGNCSYVHTINKEVFTMNGTWNFTSGIGDLKEKSQITIFERNFKVSTFNFFNKTGNYIDAIYDLKQLSNNQMVWTYKSTIRVFDIEESVDIVIVLKSR